MKKVLVCLMTLALLMGGTSAFATGEGVFTYADTIAWEGEYDVIVLGFGAAGASAAIAAADARANVLLSEKAPEGLEGGNSRFCAQLYVTVADREQGLAYYKNLRGSFKSTPDVMLEALVDGMMGLTDYLVSIGADSEKLVDWTPRNVNQLNQEYPELTGKDGIRTNMIDDTLMRSSMYRFLQDNVMRRSDSIDVWFSSPGQKLIQDPVSKTILGVQIDRNGETVNVRALDGVVLATGGFESNQQMVENYLGIAHAVPLGGVMNTGDGITMALEVGAQLWHMNSWEGNGAYGGLVHEPNRPSGTFNNAFFHTGSVILVGPDGARYMAENVDQRHGHISVGGNWAMKPRPETSYVIVDEAQRLEAKPYAVWSDQCEQEIADGFLIKGDTLDELAANAGIDAEGLKASVAGYNAAAASGEDPLGRTAESMRALSEDGPYYAMPMVVSILNTQGGPQRNENAEVLSVSGDPLPHLYSAGELGGITAHKYQGGTNLAECLISGRTAGQNAAAKKAALPDWEPLVPVTSNIKYAIGSGMQGQIAEIPTEANQYVGIGTGIGGKMYIRVTLDGDTIVAVEVVQHTETPGIGDKAIGILPDAIVAAQSTEVDTVAGATFTSDGIIQGVQEALAQVK